VKIITVTTAVVGIFTFLTVAAPYLLPVIQNRNLWAAISLIAVLLFTSGHMFNHIRKVPYVAADGKGGVSYFAGGFQNQFGLETQIVAAMCKFASIQNPRDRSTDNVFQTASSPSPPSALLSRSPEWPMPVSSKSLSSSGVPFSSACTLSSSASSESRTVATPSGSLPSERLEPEESSRTKSNCTIYSRRLAGRIYLARGVDRYNSKVLNRVDHFVDVHSQLRNHICAESEESDRKYYKATSLLHANITSGQFRVLPEFQMFSGIVILKLVSFCNLIGLVFVPVLIDE
jgi:hypothetical protein